MSLSEESINTVLADLFFEKLSEWFSSIIPGQLVRRGHRKAELDVSLAEVFGLKIVIEAKIGYNKIRIAEKKCKERLEEGLADICLAVAYCEDVRTASSIEEVRLLLKNEKNRFRVIVILPDMSRQDLSEVNLNELVEALNKHKLYDKIVSRELIETIATELESHLDEIKQLDTKVLENVASIIEKNFEIYGGYSIEGEEEE